MDNIEYFTYQPGTVDYRELLHFLEETDDLIEPRLSTRVDIVEYSKKVAKNATMFVAKRGLEWIGVEAVYFNAYPEFSFTTTLRVRKEYHNNSTVGLDLMLMQKRYLKKNGTKGLRFAIRKNNTQLLNYHLKRGARILSEHVYPNTDIVEVEMEEVYIKD